MERRSIAACLTFVSLALIILLSAQSHATATTTAQSTPLAQVKALLTSGIRATKAPGVMIPPVSSWATPSLQMGPTNQCWAQPKSSTTNPTCEFGNTSSTKVVALVGDSQIWMWVPGFDLWAKQKGWKIVVFAKASCPPWIDAQQVYWDYSPFPECGQYHTWANAAINALHPKLIIAAGLPPTWPKGYCSNCTTTQARSNFRQGIQSFATAVAPSRARVAMIAPSPNFYFLSGIRAPSCVAQNLNNLQVCNSKKITQLGSYTWGLAYSALAIPKGTYWIDTQQLLCVDGICPMTAGQYLIYYDSEHITREWAIQSAPALAQLLSIVSVGL
jgi:SGNH domain (fused to AT3 domains)